MWRRAPAASKHGGGEARERAARDEQGQSSCQLQALMVMMEREWWLTGRWAIGTLFQV